MLKDWKNWLFPVLTCLAVLALAVLPLRLSATRDGELAGTVHAEPLAEDSNFPFRPPDMAGRVWLFSQYREIPDQVLVMEQRLMERDSEDWRNAVGLADAEIEALFGAGVLPFPFLEPRNLDYTIVRLYLRNPEDLSSAGFLLVGIDNKAMGAYVDLALDGETGMALAVDLSMNTPYTYEKSPAEMGKAVLDRLGLEYALLEEDEERVAFFGVPGSGSCFAVERRTVWLNFSFLLDWDAVDTEIAEMYGVMNSSADVARAKVDAGTMQKR